jgi:hypothetical protein
MLCALLMMYRDKTETGHGNTLSLTYIHPNELRLLAQEVLAGEFKNQSFLQTPFCALDEQGNLVRHENTHDEFAAWA